jgi:hypothetical protein
MILLKKSVILPIIDKMFDRDSVKIGIPSPGIKPSNPGVESIRKITGIPGFSLL